MSAISRYSSLNLHCDSISQPDYVYGDGVLGDTLLLLRRKIYVLEWLNVNAEYLRGCESSLARAGFKTGVVLLSFCPSAEVLAVWYTDCKEDRVSLSRNYYLNYVIVQTEAIWPSKSIRRILMWWLKFYASNTEFGRYYVGRGRS